MNREKLKMLIAVSGGPDSMALFDMARRYGISLVCLHVNYHKRDTAYRDEMIVARYCQKYQIPFIKKDAYDATGNFQMWARDYRYDFFNHVAKIYGTNNILMAHQLDDYLETAIMQSQRGSTPFYFGIRAIMNEKGLRVIRPLLKYTKQDLVNYCHDNGVEYGIDESNLEDHYTRNIIRHKIIEKLDRKTKRLIYDKIETINHKRDTYLDNYRQQYTKEDYSLEEYQEIKDIRTFLRVKLYEDLGDDYLMEINRQILCSQKMKLNIRERLLLKQNDYIHFMNSDYSYCITLDSIKYLNHHYFKLSSNGDSFHGVTLKDDDFPITIRNYQDGDAIEMCYGTKKISRFFIDKKIPVNKRLTWPVMLNRKNEIILVPQIGCNKTHYSIKHNIFMIEL